MRVDPIVEAPCFTTSSAMPTEVFRQTNLIVPGMGAGDSTLGSDSKEMHRYVANANIKRFEAQLGNCSNAQLKDTLEQLLAAEQRKLRTLMRAGR